MKLEKFKEAQVLYSKLKVAERKLSEINENITMEGGLLITNGIGLKFEITNELESEIKGLIRKSFEDEVNSLLTQFDEL